MNGWMQCREYFEAKAFASYSPITSSTCVNGTAPDSSVTTTIACCSHFCRDWSSPSPSYIQHMGNKFLFTGTMNIFCLDIGKIMSIQRPLLLLGDSLYSTIHMRLFPCKPAFGQAPSPSKRCTWPHQPHADEEG